MMNMIHYWLSNIKMVMSLIMGRHNSINLIIKIGLLISLITKPKIAIQTQTLFKIQVKTTHIYL